MNYSSTPILRAPAGAETAELLAPVLKLYQIVQKSVVNRNNKEVIYHMTAFIKIIDVI